MAADGKASAPSGGDVAAMVAWAEVESERIKAAYEQYFLGIERLPPEKACEAWKREVRRLRQNPTRNTALRFRIENLMAKMNAYDRYWTRGLREMEEGRHPRQRFRMQHQQQAKKAVAPALPPPVPAEAEAEDHTAPHVVPPVARAPSGRPATPSIPDEKLRAVYDAYLRARAKAGDTSEGPPFERFAANLRRQVPEIIERHRCRSVEFKIAVGDGRAILKVLPKP